MVASIPAKEWKGRVLTHYKHQNGGAACPVPRVGDRGDEVLITYEFGRTELMNLADFIENIPKSKICECGDLLVRSYP